MDLHLATEEGGRVGINAKADSAFRILLEIFEFIDLADQGRIQFHFPHDRRKPASNYSIEKLKKPTPYFDTQLTLESDPQNGGKKKVYFTGPEFRADNDGSALPEHLRQAVLQGARRLPPLRAAIASQLTGRSPWRLLAAQLPRPMR